MKNVQLTPAQQQQVEAIKDFLTGPWTELGWEEQVYAMCQRVLENPDGPVLLSVAIEDRRFHESFVRMPVLVVLRELKDRRTLESLIVIVEQQDYVNGWIAIEALGHIGDAAAIPCLTQVLKRSATDQRLGPEAATALGEIGDSLGIDALADAMLYRWPVSEKAVLALAKIDDDRAREALLSAKDRLSQGPSNTYWTLLKVLENHSKNAQPARSDGACFIATAACGSDEATDVIRLQEFREVILRRTRFGLAVIRCYEFLSPPLARTISPSPFLRVLTRLLIVKPCRWAIELFLLQGSARHSNQNSTYITKRCGGRRKPRR